jgi:DNA-binding MarR family transcriptional regulator
MPSIRTDLAYRSYMGIGGSAGGGGSPDGLAREEAAREEAAPDLVAPVTGKPESTETWVWKNLLIGHASLYATLEAELQAAHRIVLDDYLILQLLSESKDQRLRMSELASFSAMPKSRLTYRVDQLETRQLVSREPCLDDKRGSFARLTADGNTMRELAGETHAKGLQAHLFSFATDDEKLVLGRVFSRVLAGLSYGGFSMAPNPR